MLVISDTSPISALYKIGLLDVLRQLYGEIRIPQAVYDELSILPDQLSALTTASWIVTVPSPRGEVVARLRQTLDPGESEAIALALQHEDCTLLIDELAGRRVATDYNVKIVGVLGVLILAKRSALIPEAASYIAALRALGFRLKQPLVDRVLCGLGEL